jgi:hypothetical protein
MAESLIAELENCSPAAREAGWGVALAAAAVIAAVAVAAVVVPWRRVSTAEKSVKAH